MVHHGPLSDVVDNLLVNSFLTMKQLFKVFSPSVIDCFILPKKNISIFGPLMVCPCWMGSWTALVELVH